MSTDRPTRDSAFLEEATLFNVWETALPDASFRCSSSVCPRKNP